MDKREENNDIFYKVVLFLTRFYAVNYAKHSKKK